MGAEDLALLESMGMSIVLEVREDGTASLSMMGETVDGTWEGGGDTATFTMEGESIPATISDDELSFNADEGRMIFEKENSEADDPSDNGDQSDSEDATEGVED